MNDAHKFGTEFGSDHALEQSTPIVSHHDTIKWFGAIPGEQLCIQVHGTQVNGRYAIMENIAAPGTATLMYARAHTSQYLRGATRKPYVVACILIVVLLIGISSFCLLWFRASGWF